MVHIIVKNYEHYNKAFKNWNSPYGRYISSKADYEKALQEEGMITVEQAERQGLNKGARRSDYKITQDTQELIESVKSTSDKKGKIQPGDRAIEALRKNFNYNKSVCPKHYAPKGGWGDEPGADNKKGNN